MRDPELWEKTKAGAEAVKRVVKAGKIPVLDPTEGRVLLDSIDVTTQAGLRDRALIGLVVYCRTAASGCSHETGGVGQRPGSITEYDPQKHIAFHHTMLLKRGRLTANIDVHIR